jgi:hypothetical protein
VNFGGSDNPRPWNEGGGDEPWKHATFVKVIFYRTKKKVGSCMKSVQ